MKKFELVLFFVLAWGTCLPAATKFEPYDAAFRNRRVASRAREALEGYRKLHLAEPRNVDGAWRLAMACQFVGMRLAKDSDEAKHLFAEGRDVGREAIELDPKCAPCEFWTGVNMALYGGAVGPFKTLFTLKEVRRHLRRTIELDPAYAYGGAYRILGMIEWRLPGILGGDNDRARDFFKKAITAAPDEPMNYVDLVKLLRDEFDDAKGALAVARAGMAFPKPSSERVESVDAYSELHTLFDELAPKVSAMSADARRSAKAE